MPKLHRKSAGDTALPTEVLATADFTRALRGGKESPDRMMSGKTIPLYVVCSPRRRGGKTLLSRLLTEFYVLGDRPVTAFDLCDEPPQLMDYLPQFTTAADIVDIRGQVAFFERLIAEDDAAKVIDLSHRIFKNFFTTVQKIGFFEEALRHSITPLILCVIDMHPRSPEIFATIQRWFPEASIMPVRNVAKEIAISDAPPQVRTVPASLDIPFLRLSLRTLIDGQDFSFSEFWQAKPPNLPDALDQELLDWVAGVFSQFREIEVGLGCEDSSTQIAALASRRVSTAHHAQQTDTQPLGSIRGDAKSAAVMQNVPEEIRKFAPKKVRRSAPMDLSRHPTTMLQKTTGQLQTAEDRISALETAMKQWQDRAAQAETQLLQLIQDQIKRRAG
jgi:hypothetical protein